MRPAGAARRSVRAVLWILVVLGTVVACASNPRRPAVPPQPEDPLWDWTETHELEPYLEKYPLGERGRRKDRIAATSERSMHLVQLALPLPRHVHRERKEIAYVLVGRGTIYLGETSYPAAPGAAFRIDPGVVHSAVPDEGETLIAIVFYEPPLGDEDDAIYVTGD